MKLLRTTPFLLLIYILIVGFGVEAINAAGGGLLQTYYGEYYGDDGIPEGSLKWRTEEGKAFQTFALLFGTWVYPFSVIAALLFVRRAFVEEGKWLSILCAALCLFVLYRFCSLGVYTAVTGF